MRYNEGAARENIGQGRQSVRPEKGASEVAAWLARLGFIAGLAALGWSVSIFGFSGVRLIALYVFMLAGMMMPLIVERRHPRRFQPNFRWYLAGSTIVLFGVITGIFTVGLYFFPAAFLLILATIRLTYEDERWQHDREQQ